MMTVEVKSAVRLAVAKLADAKQAKMNVMFVLPVRFMNGNFLLAAERGGALWGK